MPNSQTQPAPSHIMHHVTVTNSTSEMRNKRRGEVQGRGPSCVNTDTAQKGLYQVAMCLHDMYHRGGARKWYAGFLQKGVLNRHQLNISCLLAIIGSQLSYNTKVDCKEDTTMPQFTQLSIDLIGPSIDSLHVFQPSSVLHTGIQ